MINKTKTKTKVTVGLCVKNSEKTIKEAIASIINQTYPSELMETIVVDGGSKDKTSSIVTDMISNTDMRVELYFDEGRGLGAARQMVVDKANGNYIIFVDGDVKLLNDFVQKQVDFMEKNSQAGVAVGKYMYREANFVTTLENLNRYMLCNEFMNDDDAIVSDINYGASIYRVEVLRQIGGFDKNIKGASEDADIMARIQAKGWKLSVNEKANFYHNARETWGGLWTELKWYGYGGHFIHHKHRNLRPPLWRSVPLASLVGGLRMALKAYKLTLQKKSFLMPLLYIFKNIAWWFGFVKSHVEGYGHKHCNIR